MFDIRRYYDIKNSKFFSPESLKEDDLKNILDRYIDNFVEYLNSMLGQDADFMKNELHHVLITFDTITVKESTYKITRRDLLDAFRSSNSNNVKDFVRNYRRFAIEDDDFDNKLRGLQESLPDCRRREPEEGYKWKPRKFNGTYSNQDISDLINDYLNKELVTSEFRSHLRSHWQRGEIVLYLKAICQTRDPNETLLASFYYELFNAYHYFFVRRRFYSTWDYSQFQYNTVKAGLATFAEISYCEKEHLNISRYTKAYIGEKNMRYYPAASFNYIYYVFSNTDMLSGIDEDDTNIGRGFVNIFAYLFYMSCYDIGEAYNAITNIRFMIENGRTTFSDKTFDGFNEKTKAEYALARYWNNPSYFYANIRQYIKRYRSAYSNVHSNVQNNQMEMFTVQQVRNGLPKPEKFGDVLIRYLKKKGINDPDCYNKVNMSRSTFHKIINNNVVATPESVALLAIGLELNTSEYDDFLRAARYARSTDDTDPLNVVGFFIENGIYNMYEIESAVMEITGKSLIKHNGNSSRDVEIE